MKKESIKSFAKAYVSNLSQFAFFFHILVCQLLCYYYYSIKREPAISSSLLVHHVLCMLLPYLVNRKTWS